MERLGTFLYNGTEYSVYTKEDKNRFQIAIYDYLGPKDVLIAKLPLYGYYEYKNDKKEYGDTSLIKVYQRIKQKASNLNMKSTKEDGWENGIWVCKLYKEDPDRGIMYRSILHNMVLYSEHYMTPEGEILENITKGLTTNLVPTWYKMAKDAVISEDKNSEILEDAKDTEYYSLDELRKRIDIEHLFTNFDLKIIESEEEGDEYLDILATKPYIGYDYETNTTHFVETNEKAEITGVVVSDSKYRSRYYPFKHNFKSLSTDYRDKFFKRIKEIQDNGTLLLAHNAGFENRVNIHQNIPFFMDVCTQMGSELSISDRFAGIHGLKANGERIYGNKFLELTLIFKNRKNIDFSVLPEDIVTYYACPDGCMTIALYEELLTKLDESEKALWHLESMVTRVTAEKEYYGLRMNYPAFNKEYEVLTDIIPRLEELFKELTRSEINLNSAEKLRYVLYTKLKRRIISYTTKGFPSTSKKVLAALAKEKLKEPRELLKDDLRDIHGKSVLRAKDINSAVAPECVLLLVYKKVKKLMSAYFEGFTKRMDQDIIHCWVKQQGTATGREASPLHQLPGALKDCIIPDSDDHIFIDTDYSAVEVRLLAAMAGQTDLVEALKDPNLDIHRGIGSKMSGKEVWEIDSSLRKIFKGIVFGTPYEGSARTIAKQTKGEDITDDDIREAELNIELYYQAYNKIRPFQQRNHEIASVHLKISSYFGRHRHFPELARQDLPLAIRRSLERQANNHKIQGTGADILKIAQWKIQQKIQQLGLNKKVQTPQGMKMLCRLALTIHDQTILVAHKKVPMVVYYDLLKECMELEIDGFPPLFAVPAVVNNLGDGKSDSFAMPHGLRELMVKDYRKKGKNSVWFQTWDDPVRVQRLLSDKYREKEIINYMEKLIEEVGEENLSENIRHPNYTHDLVARFPASKEYIAKFGYPSHLESIKIAAEQYIEYRKNVDVYSILNSEFTPDIIKDELAVEEQTEQIEDNDSIINCEVEDSLLISENLFDSDGNLVIISEEDEEDVEDINNIETKKEEGIVSILYRENNCTSKYYTLANAIVFNLPNLQPDELKLYIARIDKMHNPKGIFKVQLFDGKKFIDTQRRLENINKSVYKKIFEGE